MGGNGRSRLAGLAAAPLMLALAGCGGVQTFTNPMGPKAGVVNGEWWVMVGVFGFAWLVTMILLGVAVFRNNRRRAGLSHSGSRLLVLFGGVLVPITAFFLLLVASVFIGSKIEAKPSPDALNVAVIGHQWWWEFQYLRPDGSIDFVTANEMHIPIHRQVLLHLKTDDVIHSFWVPNLSGKTDMISGLEREMWIQADQLGVYRGQCAEFCGAQHAHMAFEVVADSADVFDGWYAAAKQPARQPATPLEERGERVFLSAPCVLCHTISGTTAMGLVGPNLTHLASRNTLAADTLPNTRGNLAGWILDPQHVKPGVRMATVGLDPGDLQALLAYLESLR